MKWKYDYKDAYKTDDDKNNDISRNQYYFEGPYKVWRDVLVATQNNNHISFNTTWKLIDLDAANRKKN